MLKSGNACIDAASKLSQDFCQQGRFGAVTPKKSIETTIQKADSNSKRPEAGVEDNDQVLCSNPASESGESVSTKKKDRGSECSHKVIEKRRRDRINTSLGELSHLLPAQTLSSGKQGSGKLEKAEILELTVEYLKSLQSRLTEQQEKDMKKSEDKILSETAEPHSDEMDTKDHVEVKPVNHFGGYKDCTEEVFRFLVNVEAMDMQQPCFQRLMAHLRHQIQLLAESCPEVSSKGKISGESGKRAASKRSFQGTTSSSSSTSSSTGERSGSGGKPKRVRVHSNHSSNSKVTQSSSINGNNSNSSDNENGSENSRENQTDSAICMDDDSGKEAENNNESTGSRINNADTSRGGDSNSSSSTPPYPSMPYPSMLPQGSNIPLRTPFLPPPYPSPTYALHPAGTHFIPVILHPSVPLPVPSTPTFNGTAQMPFPMAPPAAAAFGVPPNVPSASFGFPFPYVHPAIPPYGFQASPMGFPLCSWLRKDLAGQGTANPYNGDSGSNGDDCSIESRNSSESIAIQTDSSSNESSSPDEGGS